MRMAADKTVALKIMTSSLLVECPAGLNTLIRVSLRFTPAGTVRRLAKPAFDAATRARAGRRAVLRQNFYISN